MIKALMRGLTRPSLVINNSHTAMSNYVIPHLKALYLKTND